MIRKRFLLLVWVLTLGLAVTVTASELPFGGRNTFDSNYLGASSVAVGDIDGDGRVDVVAAGYLDSTIAWWRSLSGGGFTRYDIASSVTDIYDVEVADINGDGYLDVVVAAPGGTNAVGWFENDGTPLVGSWPLRLIAINFAGAVGTAVGDLDGDGDLDVAAVAGAADVVSVAFNSNGSGIGWSYETVDASFYYPFWVAVGDIDQDGNLDVVAGSEDSGELAWWSRDPGSWNKHSISPTGSFRVAELVDIDRDGDLDTLGITTLGAIVWWENDGDGGGWTQHTIGDPDGDVNVAYPADLDLDGDDDVIFGASTSECVGWYENAGGDGLTWEIRIVDGGFTGAWDIAAGDFNGDGDLDLVSVDSDVNDVAAWENLSIHRNAAYPEGLALTGATDHVKDFAATDVDGDGDLDVLTAEWGSEQVGWFENVNGDGSSWILNSIGASFIAEAVDSGDIDGDGVIDVVGTSDTATFWWKDNGAGGWIGNSIPSTHSSQDAVTVADVDVDGDLDVILGSFTDGVDWYENDGAGGTWTEHYVTNAFILEADCMAVADIDNDGDPDVAVAAPARIEWFSNNVSDTGSFGGEIVVEDSLSNARSIAVGDIDGDGDLDLAGLEEGTDLVMWWSNSSGDGSTWGSAQTVVAGVSDPRVIELADFDLDGDLDVALAAEDRGTSDSVIAWYENLSGSGGSWASHEVMTGMIRASVLIAADLDGDGDPDIAHDRLGTNEDLWWENRGGQAVLQTVQTAPLTLDPMTQADVLTISAVHRGRVGDKEGEVAAIDLLLGDGSGSALSNAEADALLYGIYIFEDDDDSGDFDTVLDTEVGSTETFALVGGVLTIGFSDGMDNLRINPDLTRTLFVVIVFETDAADQTPGQIEIVHLAGSSVVEDRDHDLPLSLEWTENVSSGVVTPTNPGLIFADGFESGSPDQWSATVP